MNHLLIRGCAFAAVSLMTAIAGAQPSTRDLPEPLVNALLSGTGSIGLGNTPQYFVGTLPTGYPAMLVPAGPVTVVGGMRSANQIVVVLADSTRRLSPVMEDLLQASGYSHPPVMEGSGFSRALGPFRYFCKDSTTVSVEPVVGAVHEMARVSYRIGRGRKCADLVPPLPRTGILKLPPLKPFPKTEVSTSGGGAGEDEVDSHARVTGEALRAPTLLAHYAAQLIQAGWKPGEPAIGARVAAQFFEATDGTGKLWQGTMMVSESRTAMDLALVMRSH